MYGKELVKLAEKQGYRLDRISGSHHIMVKDDKTVSIPVHSGKEVPKGTAEKIMKLMGLK